MRNHRPSSALAKTLAAAFGLAVLGGCSVDPNRTGGDGDLGGGSGDGGDGGDGAAGGDGAPGADGQDGASCHDGLADQDGDGVLTAADCLWAVLCPGPIGELEDLDGDGAVTAADCREALRGEAGPGGPSAADGADGSDGEPGAPGEDGEAGPPGETGEDGDPGDPGEPGDDGGSCYEGLADQDGDGELTAADCLWAVICPSPVDEMDDENGDGRVDIEDCRELLRGPRGPGGGGDGGGDLGPDGDVDGDGIINARDNCVFTPNDGQTDLDLDSLGDDCDPDRDGDGSPNDEDCWPDDPERAPGVGEDTICDGLDDDCDGEIDEDFVSDACETGEVGVCSAGTRLCANGAEICLQDVQASDEECDRLDNDCDGEADEDDGQGECAPALNQDLGGIPFCVEVEGPEGARIGVFNSRDRPLQRHNGYANWEDFCVGNGWDGQNSGDGNGNDDCNQVMDRRMNDEILAGRGGWQSANYPPNRAPGSHVFHTCIIR